MSLVHANNFSTTLNGSITNSQTTMTLTTVSGAPTVGSGANCNFTITDGTNYEIVQATSLSISTYTISRGTENTTSLAWGSGATVEINCTRDSLDKKLDAPTSLTNYMPICGPASTNGVTQQVNSATSGLPLLSAGSSALPAYGKLDISSGTNVQNALASANGGTGLATLSAYAVLCGGTTTTGILQQVSGIGTTGQVLTSNGTGALPTWQNSTALGSISWSTISASQIASANSGYITNATPQLSITLPATAVKGTQIALAGSGLQPWKLIANTGQTIQYLGQITTSGGNIVAANQYDTIQVICVIANTTWVVISSTSTLLTLS